MPDYVTVNVYISNVEGRVQAEGEYALFEINGANGTVLCWNITNTELVNGWNELTLNVSDALRNTITDISTISSVRYFQYTYSDTTISVGEIELGYNA